MPNFSIISACDLYYGIGMNNRLPWSIPAELKYFQQITDNSTVIMGRNTWESLPNSSKPLSNRQNIVISRDKTLQLPQNVILCHSLNEALEQASHQNIFVIGGAQLYAESINHPNCNQVFLTRIQSQFDCDTFFPGDSLAANFILQTSSDINTDNGFNFIYEVYTLKSE